MGVNAVHHICIQTEDYVASMDFYTNILGFVLYKETANFHKRNFNTWLQLGDFYIELQTGKIHDKLTNYSSSSEGIVHICFLVDDVVKELDRIKKLGHKNFKLKNNEILYKVEKGYLFKLIAPEGTEVEIRDSKI